MSFEPLIHISEIYTVLIIAAGAGLATFIISGLTCMDIRRKKREMTEELFFSRILLPFALCCCVIGIGIQTDRIAKNEAIVRANVSQKYAIEELEFSPSNASRTHYRDYYPEQSDPQPVMIKANGVTRPATLKQDDKTSEPTLLDVDNGKPLDNLLRTKP